MPVNTTLLINIIFLVSRFAPTSHYFFFLNFSYHYFHHFHSILLLSNVRDTINFTIYILQVSMLPIIKNNFKHLFIKLFLMFLFYFCLSALTSILFLPFENLASLPLLFSLSASLPLSRVCCCLIPIADLARSLSFVVVVVFFLVVCVCVFWLLWIFWLSAVVQSLWFWLVPNRSLWIVNGGLISVVQWLVEWVLDVGWGGCLAGVCERGDHAFFLF